MLSDLRPKERFLLIELIAQSDKDGVVVTSQRSLSDAVGISRRQVVNVIGHLQELGILEQKNESGPKACHLKFNISALYSIFEPKTCHSKRTPSFSLLSLPPTPPYIINSLITPEKNISRVKELKKENNELRKLVTKLKGDETDAGVSTNGITFDEFWEAYGLKKDKGSAMKAWNNLSKINRQRAYDAIQSYKDDCKRNGRFMKYAQGYLNQKTWEDDLMTVQKPQQQSLFGGDRILHDNSTDKFDNDEEWK